MPNTIRPTSNEPELDRSSVHSAETSPSAEIILDQRDLDTLLQRAERDPALLPPFFGKVLELAIRDAISTGSPGDLFGAIGKVTVVASSRACIADFGGSSYLVEIGLSSGSRLCASVRGVAKPLSE